MTACRVHNPINHLWYNQWKCAVTASWREGDSLSMHADVSQFVSHLRGHDPPPCHMYIYIDNYTDQYLAALTTISCLLGAIQWFTKMRIYNASQTGRAWLTEAHSQPLASFWITDTGHIQQSLYEAYTESPQRRIGHTSEARIWDIRMVFYWYVYLATQ